jgi:hypothetical protein
MLGSILKIVPPSLALAKLYPKGLDPAPTTGANGAFKDLK